MGHDIVVGTRCHMTMMTAVSVTTPTHYIGGKGFRCKTQSAIPGRMAFREWRRRRGKRAEMVFRF